MMAARFPTMDMTILRESLPSGLTVWKIDNEVPQCQQRVVYEIVTPTFAASGKILDDDVEVDVQSTVEKKALEPSRPAAMRSSIRVPSLLQQIAGHIDDVYSILPSSMKRATEVYLKQKLLSFVMSEEGNHVLGPKKCRECVAYIQTSMVSKCDAFFLLCSFLLDAKIVVDHQVHTWNHQHYVSEVVLQCKN